MRETSTDYQTDHTTALAGERKFVLISDEHRHGMEQRRLLHVAQCTDSGKQWGQHLPAGFVNPRFFL